MLTTGTDCDVVHLAVGLFQFHHVSDDLHACNPRTWEADKPRSGILCAAIVGGARSFRSLARALADAVGVQLAFVLPVACACHIVFYGLPGFDAVDDRIGRLVIQLGLASVGLVQPKAQLPLEARSAGSIG